jgi:hypothetical protein
MERQARPLYLRNFWSSVSAWFYGNLPVVRARRAVSEKRHVTWVRNCRTAALESASWTLVYFSAFTVLSDVNDELPDMNGLEFLEFIEFLELFLFVIWVFGI